VGARIETYLLEKVRVVAQSTGERNYHAFYQLCAGASPADRARWHLGPPTDYRLINTSNCYTLKDVSDADEYAVTRGAMGSMGIRPSDVDALFGVLAGLLHLSNVGFAQAATEKATDQDKAVFAPGCADSVAHACGLLGVAPDALQAALTSKEIKVGSELFKQQFSVPQASAAIEALGKAVYGRLFLWLVHAINRQIRAEDRAVAHFIGESQCGVCVGRARRNGHTPSRGRSRCPLPTACVPLLLLTRRRAGHLWLRALPDQLVRAAVHQLRQRDAP
jgi:myosin heavy subunit